MEEAGPRYGIEHLVKMLYEGIQKRNEHSSLEMLNSFLSLQMQQPQQAPQPQPPAQPQSQPLGLQAMQPQQPLVRPRVLVFRHTGCILL